MAEVVTEIGFWQRRLIGPIKSQLSQGITPEKVALTLALGAVLGVFPILGSTMVLCGLAAWRFQLNQPIIQTLNYLVYPLQLLLLLPFYRAGEWLFQQAPIPLFSVSELLRRFSESPLHFVGEYGLIALHGVAVWCLLAPVVALLIYHLSCPVLLALNSSIHGER